LNYYKNNIPNTSSSDLNPYIQTINVTLLQLLGTNEEEIGKELLQNAEAESLLDFRQISDLEAWLKDAEKSIV